MNLSLPLIQRKLGDYLAGRSTLPLAADIHARLVHPWSDYYQYILNNILPSPDQQDQFLTWFTTYLSTRDEREMSNLFAITRAYNAPAHYPPVSEMLDSIPDFSWMWDSWLLTSLWTILAGAPGTGKSYLVQKLAQIICLGGTWPNGQKVDAAPVLYVDAENRAPLYKPRFKTWPTAALKNLHLFSPDQDRGHIYLDEPDDQARLLDRLWAIQPSALIIDSFGSASRRPENSKEDVAPSVSFYNQITREFGISLIVVHHLNKLVGGQINNQLMTIDRVRGSSHLITLPTIVWGLQRIQTTAQLDSNPPCQWWIMKSNAAQIPEPLGIQLTSHPDDPQNVAVVNFIDAPKFYQKPTKKQTCGDWLLDLLADGKPRKPSAIFELAADHDPPFSRSTVYNARKTLAEQIIDTTPTKTSPTNCWTIPD